MQDHSQLNASDGFYRSLWDGMPSPAFVVTDDLIIVDSNFAARKMIDAQPEQTVLRRAGEVLYCAHANDAPEGCGHGPACVECLFRDAVTRTLNGNKVFRRMAKMEIAVQGQTSESVFLLSASPLNHGDTALALVVIEGFNNNAMLTMCAHCRQVRNHLGNWQCVEDYFQDHMDIAFSHGLCPECARIDFSEHYNKDGDLSSSTQ